MNRRTNILNNILYMLITFGGLFAVVLVCNKYHQASLITVVGWVLLGGVVAGLFNAFAHELGHLIAGKRNGFKLSCICVWFFKWTRVGKKLVFSWTFPWNEAGYTEMVPTTTDNMAIRYKKMTRGGIWISLIFAMVGAVALFFPKIPLALYCIWAMFLPIGLYYFFGNILPMTSGKIRNDGAVLLGLRRLDDVSKVTLSLLQIQAESFNGKTPSEIDEKLLFDLPQLAEDELTFIMLLDARYNYYLDKKDYENVVKVSDRLATLLDYMPKHVKYQIQTNLLYNACTFDYNEEEADDLMYELESFLNNVNNATTVRAKLAYMLYVQKEKENAEIFYKKGVKEAKRFILKGYGDYEIKLFEELKKDF